MLSEGVKPLSLRDDCLPQWRIRRCSQRSQSPTLATMSALGQKAHVHACRRLCLLCAACGPIELTELKQCDEDATLVWLVSGPHLIYNM